MELLFITLAGVIIGAIARYALPGRHSHGSMLIPGIGAAVAAAAWVGFTWLGLKWNGGWIWVIVIAITAVVVVGLDLLIAFARTKSDSRLLASLSKGAAVAR